MSVKIHVESLSDEYRRKLCGRALTRGTIDRLATEVSRKYLLQKKVFKRAAVIYAAVVVLLLLLTFLSPAAREGSIKAILIAFGFLVIMGIVIFTVIYHAVVTRIPRQFARCLEKGYPELEMLYGYDRIISGSAATGGPSQQVPFSMQIEGIFRLESGNNIVVTGFAHGLIKKGASVYIMDKNNPVRESTAVLVARIELEGGKPVAQAADCFVALEIVDGKEHDLREGMYLYREKSL